MKAHFILILALGACLCAACQQSTTPSPASPTPVRESTATPPPDPEAEEYAVYNDLLRAKFKGDDIDQIFIIDQTRINSPKLLERDLAAFQESTPLAPELVASFKERNQGSHQLRPVLEFGMDYQLWTQEEVDELRPLDEASGWKLFYEKYPKAYGFVYLSRVGFNADFSQALIYIESFHYEQPIQGGYYLMVRADGRWVIDNSYEWMT